MIMKYRVGKKQSRVILDENGNKVAECLKGNEDVAKRICDLLNEHGLVSELPKHFVIYWTPLSEQQPPEQGHYLVHRPTSFPKNYRGSVAEYYEDNQRFYCEFGDSPIEDVTHWANIPTDPL